MIRSNTSSFVGTNSADINKGVRSISFAAVRLPSIPAKMSSGDGDGGGSKWKPPQRHATLMLHLPRHCGFGTNGNSQLHPKRHQALWWGTSGAVSRCNASALLIDPGGASSSVFIANPFPDCD